MDTDRFADFDCFAPTRIEIARVGSRAVFRLEYKNYSPQWEAVDYDNNGKKVGMWPLKRSDGSWPIVQVVDDATAIAVAFGRHIDREGYAAM
jgi:hypothetical protein